MSFYFHALNFNISGEDLVVEKTDYIKHLVETQGVWRPTAYIWQRAHFYEFHEKFVHGWISVQTPWVNNILLISHWIRIPNYR